MALSTHGNRIGMAAHAERVDFARELWDQQRAEKINALLKRRDELQQACIAFEGASTFWAWWDSPAVPEHSTHKVYLEMLEKRLESLKAK